MAILTMAMPGYTYYGHAWLYLLWPCLQEGFLAGEVRGAEGRAEDVHAVTVAG